jgi:hypothetical protein
MGQHEVIKFYSEYNVLNVIVHDMTVYCNILLRLQKSRSVLP